MESTLNATPVRAANCFRDPTEAGEKEAPCETPSFSPKASSKKKKTLSGSKASTSKPKTSRGRKRKVEEEETARVECDQVSLDIEEVSKPTKKLRF